MSLYLHDVNVTKVTIMSRGIYTKVTWRRPAHKTNGNDFKMGHEHAEAFKQRKSCIRNCCLRLVCFRCYCLDLYSPARSTLGDRSSHHSWRRVSNYRHLWFRGMPAPRKPAGSHRLLCGPTNDCRRTYSFTRFSGRAFIHSLTTGRTKCSAS